MREPYVSGQFYPKSKEELKTLIASFLDPIETEVKSKAGIAPHAGYLYSGKTAAYTHSALVDTDTYVIIGPDHTGGAMGRNIAYPSGEWKTPLGSVSINQEMTDSLKDIVATDKKAHKYEHSLEVQVPFLQTIHPHFEIVPIIMGDQSLDSARELGEALAEHECAVIASSDFSHYVPHALAQENDEYSIQGALDLDEEEFISRIRERNVTACGPGPIAASIVFAKAIGCIEGQLLDYSTSGDVTGDQKVVGYASIVFV